MKAVTSNLCFKFFYVRPKLALKFIGLAAFIKCVFVTYQKKN
jgi:hypothetical protein